MTDSELATAGLDHEHEHEYSTTAETSSTAQSSTGADTPEDRTGDAAADDGAAAVDGEQASGEQAAGEDAAGEDATPSSGRVGSVSVTELEQEGEVAADYLEELLDICDLDGDLDLDVENGRAMVAIVGDGLDHLVGRGGETLDALQELTRLAVLTATGRRSRLMLDVAGYRAGRRTELTAQGLEAAARVLETGQSARLAPMNPFERKIVHDAVAGIDGVHSESEGEEPSRRVVILRD